MQLYFFWLLTIIAVLFSLACIVPVLWLPSTRAVLSKQWSYAATALCVFALPSSAYALYLKHGVGSQLSSYYTVDAIKKRKDMAQIRPVYAKLQREIIKADLNLATDLTNLELILHFANVHSQLSSGILPTQILNLLNNVLQTTPLQVTALNLLAMHSYQSAEYRAAIKYWQKILQQFTPEMLKSNAGIILTAKIAQARNLQAAQL